jgi:hypothetical protein
LFLASDDAGFMTGEILNVDNGFSLNHNYTFSAEVLCSNFRTKKKRRK